MKLLAVVVVVTAVLAKIEGTPIDLTSSSQYPFLAVINTGLKECLGSIIRKDAVLTSALCVFGAENVNVLVGRYKRGLSEDQYQTIPSSNVIIHEEFNKHGRKYDIALVILSKRVVLNSNVEVVEYNRKHSNFENANVTIAGPIRSASSQVISNKQCELSLNAIFDEKTLCIDSSSSWCVGESGSPIFIQRFEKPVVIGVNAFEHADGCSKKKPSGYTKVSEFVEWIQSKLP